MNSCVLFGGTFDPPHLGHQMIVEVIKNLNLGEIIIIPNKNPYYKDHVKTNDIDRLNMVEIMFGNYKIDRYELEHNVYSPTFETIMRYKKKYKKIYFVLGSDSYATIKTWHNYQYLMENCNFIIINRGNDFELQKASDIIIDNEILDISSTKLRAQIIEENLTKEVYNYIKERGLYAKKDC